MDAARFPENLYLSTQLHGSISKQKLDMTLSLGNLKIYFAKKITELKLA